MTPAFRLVAMVACIVNLAAGAPLHRTSGKNSDPRPAESGKSSDADATPAIYKWNIADKQLPLLGLADARLSPRLDQSLTYPLDQFSFPIFQGLDYDDEQGKYLLPSISRESKGVHFIEFASTEIKNTYISTDGTNIKLIDNDTLKTVRTSNGTKYTFVRYPDGEFRCAGIKEPNGDYLSLIYRANGLTLHGIVDSAGRTITFDYTSEGITSVTQTWMANSEGLSKTWLLNDPQLIASVIPTSYSRSARAAALKALPTNALIRVYTPEMARSDLTLARLFGGPTAVAAANGFEPAGLAASYPLYRGDIMGDDGRERRGHLAFAMHLYGTPDGTGDSPLFVPEGFVSHSGPPSPTDAVVTFYYPRLGNLTDVTLAVFHVADFQISNEGSRVRIGNLGGPGGSSALYKHSHIEFYRGNTGLPPLSTRQSLRIDPAKVFAIVE